MKGVAHRAPGLASARAQSAGSDNARSTWLHGWMPATPGSFEMASIPAVVNVMVEDGAAPEISMRLSADWYWTLRANFATPAPTSPLATSMTATKRLMSPSSAR